MPFDGFIEDHTTTKSLPLTLTGSTVAFLAEGDSVVVDIEARAYDEPNSTFADCKGPITISGMITFTFDNSANDTYTQIKSWISGESGTTTYEATDDSRAAEPAVVKRILQTARKLVARGWTGGAVERGYVFGLYKQYCAMGALRMAGDGDSRKGEVSPPTLAAIIAMQDQVGNISYWNDAENRKKRDVLSAFDRAIAAV